MRDFQKYLILALAAFCLGWGAQSVMGIGMRKAANSRFVMESEATLKTLRGLVAKFRADQGRFPSGVGELYAKGLLDPAAPPVESLRRGGRWLGDWDGEGGFVYVSATGQLFLNADVSREKFFKQDWQHVKEGGLFPPGKVY